MAKHRPVLATVLCAVMLIGASAAESADGAGAAAFASMMKAWSAGDLDAAIAAADRVLKAEPRNVGYLFSIGGLYCEKAQKANVLTQLSWSGKCHSTWERALTIDPKDMNVRFALLQFYLQAPGIAGGGRDKAEAQAASIQQLDPVRGEIAWGQIFRAGKRMADAEQRYRKAAELDAHGMRGPSALASFYVGEGRWREAKEIFEARLAKDAGDRFAAFQLARLIQSEGAEIADALPLFDRYLSGPAVTEGPSHADAWFRKGQVLDKLGRKAEAQAAFEAALKLAPNHSGASRELARLKG